MVIFQSDFFGGFVPKRLTTSFITFNMCFSKFISETGVWSHVREILAIVCKFMANDDSERNKARFSGKRFQIKHYEAGGDVGVETHC